MVTCVQFYREALDLQRRSGEQVGEPAARDVCVLEDRQ